MAPSLGLSFTLSGEEVLGLNGKSMLSLSIFLGMVVFLPDSQKKKNKKTNKAKKQDKTKQLKQEKKILPVKNQSIKDDAVTIDVMRPPSLVMARQKPAKGLRTLG